MTQVSQYSTVTIDLLSQSESIARKMDISLGTIHGIGFSEYRVLYELLNSTNKTARRIDLAEATGRTASGITKMLLPMEKIGLVQKESNPRDARVSLVKLTKAGERIFTEASATFDERSQRLFQRLSKKELSELVKLLDKLD